MELDNLGIAILAVILFTFVSHHLCTRLRVNLSDVASSCSAPTARARCLSIWSWAATFFKLFMDERRSRQGSTVLNAFDCTQIGGEHFAAFRTTASKSRLNFLALLRGNYQDYVLNDAAFTFLENRQVDPALLAHLKTCEPRRFANRVPFLGYLAANGIDIFDKDIIRPFAEAGIWGAIRHHGLVGNAVIVSDDAGQFRVGTHALCWIHAERLLHKLMPATPGQVKHVEALRACLALLQGSESLSAKT
ncbi:hypothetical protein [Rhizobium leguminosarum]|uniref:hypothetical protein n=1 Tax=Rhizobium leguminosarum TaxID=384 RepID=UPI0021BBC8B7|nr:hypothetical protein [Rhizobium leguminosarum]